MPSASVAESSVTAPDLECSGCGNPIIINGQFKCLRCRPRRLVPATLGKQSIVCPRHRPPVVLMRYGPRDLYRAYCQKSGCPNRIMKIGTPIHMPASAHEGFGEAMEDQMTHSTSSGQTLENVSRKAPPAGGSKTQELRDWLDVEIERVGDDIGILENGISRARDFPKRELSGRYETLTSDERKSKLSEDQEKLEQLKKRLELLRSARELDVDVDAMETSLNFWKFSIDRTSLCIRGDSDVYGLKAYGMLRIHIGKRTLEISSGSPSGTGYNLHLENLQKIHIGTEIAFIFPEHIVTMTRSSYYIKMRSRNTA